MLFIDRAYRNWYLGLNFELVVTVSGEKETEFEFAAATLCSLLKIVACFTNLE